MTLYGSKSNLTVSLGFFVLVLGAIAASLLIRGSTGSGVVFAVLAVGLIVLTIVLHSRPATELHVTSDRIEMTRPNRVIGTLTREETGGRVDVQRRIWRGRIFWSLVPAGAEFDAGLGVDDFVPEEIRAAVEQAGWTVRIVE